MKKLDTITIKGFKSIKELNEFKLNPLNILIGANGSGKSNFIKVFELLNRLIKQELQTFIGQEGGADDILHFSQKTTKEIRVDLRFDGNGYRIRLVPTTKDRLVFKEETCLFFGGRFTDCYEEPLGSGHEETNILKFKNIMKVPKYVFESLESWIVYHFHDTSFSAKVRIGCNINDNRFFKHDAENLSAFLFLLKNKYPINYNHIVNTIKQVAPFFKDFVLEPDRNNSELIRLVWSHVGTDRYFDAHALSDGTLRFICLATLFQQPSPPKTILLDEPELGLHPYAIFLLSEMIKAASKRTQIIISTQSVTFINQFSLNDIIVVERDDEQSMFKRLDKKEMEGWLKEYGLGELWEKNVIGGRP